ncbi:protein DpdH [Streptomyces polygonati]|uniref:Protein DpdH n=1 Tax=Streptomyces polygonati TaxID=1617087 RepID=A0ABV8HRK7_9ACTN
MPDFRGTLCWDPATVADTVGTEAISLSAAVFKATHAPLRIKRARLLDERQLVLDDTPVDEHAVLHDFLGHESNTGALLLPIVGESGSGKSHLVRWVREHLALVDDRSASREVIYLEKSKTSLKAVIKSLIARADSDRLNQLSSEVDRFTADVDEASLARRLVHALSETLAAETGTGISGPARQLFGTRGLAALLDDPHVSAYMLGSDKFIPQLASHLLRDRTAGEGERPLKFTVDDLPLDITDVGKASDIAKKWVQHLTSKADLQEVAIGLLNQHLDSAVNRSFNLGMGRLLEAMTLVREEYHKQGKEIILLIEEFALIQGVQRDLLDALVEAAHREGTTILAPIRTLMAVTTGYFRDSFPETVLTRIRATIGYAYDLDVPFGPDDAGAEQMAGFVGRYLNAARIGRQELERSGDSGIPNACDRCPLQSRCHDSFGASGQGFGLYPFNRSALLRTVHATAPKNEPWAFIPRTVLGSVVRPVLIEHAGALRRGEFPDPSFKAQFPASAIDEPLGTQALEAIEQSDLVDADRRKIVLEVWADAAARGLEIDPVLLEAFALPPLLKGVQVPMAPEPAEVPTNTASKQKIAPSVATHLANAENWVTRGDDLQQDPARIVRKAVATAVAQRYRWNTPLMRQQTSPKDNGWPNNATVVSIEGAGVEGITGADTAPIRFKRSATNSRFFRSLIRAESNLNEVRGEDVRRLATIAERHSEDFATRIQKHLEITDQDLVLGMRASLIGAALAGRAWPGMKDEQLLAAIIDDGTGWLPSSSAAMSERWSGMLSEHLSQRTTLVERIRTGIGIAQGTGAVRMLDAARALPLVEKAASDWSWQLPPGTALPAWVRPAVKRFATWSTVIDGQLRMLEELLEEIRKRQPRGTPGKHTHAAIRSALTTAREGNLSLTTERDRTLRRLLDRVDDADWAAVTALEDDLERALGAGRPPASRAADHIRAAVKDRGSSLTVICDLLTAADDWLDEALKGAQLRASSSAATNAAAGMQELAADWRSLGEGTGGQ